MADNRSQQPSVNRLDLINSDPDLSQLKYHLVLNRVCIPQGQFGEFSASVGRGFVGCDVEKDAICIVQIIESFDMNLFDVVCGFRRDSQALRVYQTANTFFYNNKESDIELQDCFKIVLEAKGIVAVRGSRAKSQQVIDLKLIQNRSPSKKAREDSIRKDSRSRSRERERERERAEQKLREGWAGKLWAVFAPSDWGKATLESRLSDALRCAKKDVYVEEKKEDIPHFLIYLRSQTLINNLMSGTRATEGVLLLLKDEEVQEQGLKQAVRQRQLKAIRSSTVGCQNPFNDLCRQLVSFRQFNLRVVTVAPFQGNFVVVTQNQVLAILKFLRIANWRFESVSQYIRINSSSTDLWQEFLNLYKPH